MKFNEDTRVKFPVMAHFLRLGYKWLDKSDCEIEFNTKIFVNVFKKSISRINNKEFNDIEIKSIISDINALIRANDLGKSFYNWLINPSESQIKLIDFDNIYNNDFNIAAELPFSIKERSEEGSFRPDINILINGIPLSFLEVKKPSNEGGIQVEFNRMINKRLSNDEYKRFFNLIQITSFSNNMEYQDADNADINDVKAGSFYTTPNGFNTSFSFFREDIKDYHSNYHYLPIDMDIVKKILIEENYDIKEIETPEFKTSIEVNTPCNKFVTSFYDKERFMYFLQYGLMYLTEIKTSKVGDKEEKIPVPQKHIMRYPQFFATRKIVERLENGGRGGIIWHTQGSGKTALAAFSNRILKDYYAKKGINARMFFIVDRLDLMIQATNEFSFRNFNVTNCDNKIDLGKELAKNIDKEIENTIGNICVVNIQRIDPEEIPYVKNDYNIKTQRIFFVDEAHRSYAKGTGEFYKNLMTCDENGIYIAMTGTPLLNSKTRSNLRWGDYIHKYFYDKSIADGYTLRIKKEEIETVARKEIRANLDIEKQDLTKDEVFESNDFVNCVSKYIEKDFNYFRLENDDKTIGGMIVCRTNKQAKLIYEWFKKSSSLNVGLVISDEENPKQKEENVNLQASFKSDNVPDILVVNQMLTTGYDVKRLKKMYLLRAPKAHSLLQTVSRVNRPYKNKDGKVYKFGYIVDFVDIAEEYDMSLKAYVKELQDDSNIDDEEGGLSGLIIDKEDIYKKYQSYMKELTEDFNIDFSNLEITSRRLTKFNKESLLRVKELLNNLRDCKTEFELSRATEYIDLIDKERTKKMLNDVQNKINFINIKTQSIDTLKYLNNEEVMKVIYEFFKSKNTKIMFEELLDKNNPIYKAIEEKVNRLKYELKRNVNNKDPKIEKLEELINKIFEEMNISTIDNLTEELEKAIKEAKTINEENERLASLYGGHYSFVRTYKEILKEHNELSSKTLEECLIIVYEYLKNKLTGTSILIQSKNDFISSICNDIVPDLFNKGLYGDLDNSLDDILSSLYTSIQIYGTGENK